MSWLDTFKNDERSLKWLVEYIHYNNLFYVDSLPRDILEARKIIQHWEKKSAERPTARLKYELSKLMKSYFANVLPIEDYDWLSANDSKQLYWVLFYLNLNPMRQRYDVPTSSFCRGFASNIREAYPIIIKTLDSSMPLGDDKKSYLLTLKSAYSQYLIGKRSLIWLDIKDEETCSWVWRYLIEKVDEASGQRDTLQFIKPVDNETIYWSCISLIANWFFLNDRFVEEVKVPIFEHTFICSTGSDDQIELNYFNYETLVKNIDETENTIPNTITFLTLSSIEPIDTIECTIDTIECTIDTYKPCIIYDGTNYSPDTELPQKNNLFQLTLKRKGIMHVRIGPAVRLTYDREQMTNPIIASVDLFAVVEKDKLPTKEELTSSLYNAHKQRILRQKSYSQLGLNKANQKKLTNYAKEQNTTEKKALNEIVKTMLD